MAIIPETAFPGKIAPSSAPYPYGEARDVTTPGDGTGTPWKALLLNDVFGFQQALLADAGVTPSGSPDTALVSQYLGAVKAIAGAPVTNMLDLLAIPAGQRKNATVLGYFAVFPQSSFLGGGPLVWQETLDKNLADGGLVFDPDTLGGFDGTVSTRDAFLAAQGTGVGFGCWVRVGYAIKDALMYGAVRSGVVDDVVAVQKAVDAGGATYIPKGTGIEKYLLSTAIDISASNTYLTSNGAVLYRDTTLPFDSGTIQNFFAVKFTGDATQENVRVSGFNFAGNGNWGGITSVILYQALGWGAGGSPANPVLDELNYTTTRKNFSITENSFSNPQKSAIFLSSVSGNIDGISITDHDDTDFVGAINVRNTENINVSNINLDGYEGKGVGCSYARNVTYSNINGVNAGITNLVLAFYFGHFTQTASATNINAKTGPAFKTSYYAKDITISNVNAPAQTFKSFAQGSVDVEMTNCNLQSVGVPTAIEVSQHTTYGTINPENVYLNGCLLKSDTVSGVNDGCAHFGGMTNCGLRNSEVFGRIFGRDGSGLYLEDNKLSSSAGQQCEISTQIDDLSVVLRNEIGPTTSAYSIKFNGNTANDNTVVAHGNIIAGSSAAAGGEIVKTSFGTNPVYNFLNNSMLDGANYDLEGPAFSIISGVIGTVPTGGNKTGAGLFSLADDKQYVRTAATWVALH